MRINRIRLLIFTEYALKTDIYGGCVCVYTYMQNKGDTTYILVGRNKVMNILPCSCGNASKYEGYYVISKVCTSMLEELQVPKLLRCE